MVLLDQIERPVARRVQRLRGTRQKLILGGIVGAYLAFQLLAGTGLIGARYYETAATDTSAASHQSLLDVALKVAFDHPLIGIGHEHFEEVSLQYVDEVPASNGDEAIGNERPHNDFLTVWISWGIGALIARGWMVNAVNPKGTVFLLAVVPQFLNLHHSLTQQYAVIGATLAFTDAVVMAGYTLLAARVLRALRSESHLKAMNRIFGSLFVGAGALLATFKKAAD